MYSKDEEADELAVVMMVLVGWFINGMGMGRGSEDATVFSLRCLWAVLFSNGRALRRMDLTCAHGGYSIMNRDPFIEIIDP